MAGSFAVWILPVSFHDYYYYDYYDYYDYPGLGRFSETFTEEEK